MAFRWFTARTGDAARRTSASAAERALRGA
jgi:hypothetical protein